MTWQRSLRASPFRKAQQIRHSVANWLAGLSLRARLSLLVALVVAIGIVMATYLQVRVVERTIEQALVSEAESTAQTITDDLRARRVDPGDITDRLHDFIEANPAVRVITVVGADHTDPAVLASTSSE